jgi:predicted nucleic acid-binding protein
MKRITLSVQSLLNAMIDIAQYWVSATLYQQVLRQAGEVAE